MSKKADIFIIIACSLLLVPLALLTSGALRIVLSLAFVLFFPGYTLIAALFPAKGRLDGTSQVAINLHHLGTKVTDCVGDGSRFGIAVSYSHEETLQGTAGGVKKMEPFFDDTFVVIYGDILTDLDLTAMIRFHREGKSVATLALFEAPNPREVGIVEIDKAGRVLTFVEKPQSPPGNLANGAVYVLEKTVLSYIPDHGFCDFGHDIFPRLVGAGLPLYGYPLTESDYLIDIGTPEKYHRANEDMKAGKLWKLSPVPSPQSPIPNPESPTPSPQSPTCP